MEPPPSQSSSHKRGIAPKRSSALPINDSSSSTPFPEIDTGGDLDNPQNYVSVVGSDPVRRGSFDVGNLLQKVPQSLWQPNAVVQRHRRKANMYWLMLIIGYAVYIGLVSGGPKVVKICKNTTPLPREGWTRGLPSLSVYAVSTTDLVLSSCTVYPACVLCSSLICTTCMYFVQTDLVRVRPTGLSKQTSRYFEGIL